MTFKLSSMSYYLILKTWEFVSLYFCVMYGFLLLFQAKTDEYNLNETL